MPDADRRLWLDNYDPSRYLPGVYEPILFVNGTNDFAYPLNSYQRSYQLAKGPRTLCVTVRMPHDHPQGWAPKEIGLFVDSVINKGKPLAQFGPVTTDGTWGKKVTASVRSVVPVKAAALHYTTDLGTWNAREWKTVLATLDAKGAIAAELPAGDGITWFLTVTDERGATVSSEHQVRAQRTDAARRG